MQFYFVGEHLLRFLHLREPHDYYTGPPWYYLPRLLLYLAPWSLFLPLLAIRRPEPDEPDLRLKRFLWCWFGWCLFFFSVSLAKANYYMFVGLPPLVMLLAERLETLQESRPKLIASIASCTLLLIAASAGTLLMLGRAHPALQPYCLVLTPGKVVLLGALLIIGLAGCLRAAPAFWPYGLALPLLFIWTLFLCGIAREDDFLSQKSVARYLDTHHAHAATALYRDYEEFSAFAFYIPHPITVVDSDSADLLYGQRRANSEYFLTLAQWVKRIDASEETARLIVNNRYLPSLQERLAQMPQARSRHMEVSRFARVSVVTLESVTPQSTR